MQNLFNFLDHQSGSRLFWYGVLLVIVVGLLMEGLVLIFDAIASIFNKQKTK